MQTLNPIFCVPLPEAFRAGQARNEAVRKAAWKALTLLRVLGLGFWALGFFRVFGLLGFFRFFRFSV